MSSFEEEHAALKKSLLLTKKTLKKMDPSVKEELIARKRLKEISRTLLPDALPRKRARKQSSPERTECHLVPGTPTVPPSPKLQPWQMRMQSPIQIQDQMQGIQDRLSPVSSVVDMQVDWTTGLLKDVEGNTASALLLANAPTSPNHQMTDVPVAVLPTIKPMVKLINEAVKGKASYIHVCERDPNTIETCALKSIELLRPQLSTGIPELDVPPLDPFFIPEIKALTADNTPLRAIGQNIKVTGASAFSIKSLSVDLDTLKIKVRVRFPKLHFEGEYKLDSQILVLPLRGAGTLNADAVKCDAEFVIHTQVTKRDGAEYIKFKKIDADINIKDYRVKLDGLFNGDKALGEAANQAINQNRGELLKATKPHLEKTVTKNLLEIANKVVDGLTLDQLLPKP